MKEHSFIKIKELIDKGVEIPCPGTIEIGAEVNVDRISGDGVVLYSGCKIFGESTLILKGAKLGYEAPVTVDDCFIGPLVELKGGFFKQAVFLKKVSMGCGAHIRAGTILEEQASGAHAVALKQTILFPFVTLGSLINFCDCFMSGGTSRKDHSEVGSSYIHFNYTPIQDKATASLIGDVPQGVMLNQRPIFLGGQGGLVGPTRLAYGTIIGAGSIRRKDELRQGRLILEAGGKSINMAYTARKTSNVKRIVHNNIIYIANLIALMQWYIAVRSRFLADEFPEPLLAGLKTTLNTAIDERIKRLKDYFEIISPSPVEKQQKKLSDSWPELENSFKELRYSPEDSSDKDIFLEKIAKGINEYGKDYIAVIKNLNKEDAQTGTRWLQGIVDKVIAEILKIAPI